MYINWCVLIEISMEIGMLNFLDVINCFCNGAWNSLYYVKHLDIVKFRFSKKATKFETISHMIWRLLSKYQIKWDCFKFLWPFQNVRILNLLDFMRSKKWGSLMKSIFFISVFRDFDKPGGKSLNPFLITGLRFK